MEPSTLTFALFPALPKELRLQIWQYSLPPPNLLEFAFGYHQIPDLPLESDLHWDRMGPRMWATRSGPTRPSLLEVNTEAREVALGSYETVSVCDQSSPNFTITHVDFSRDTILMSRFAWDCFHKSNAEECPSPWTEEVQHFALMPYTDIEMRTGGPESIFDGLSAKHQSEISPQDRKSDLNFCARIFAHFPHLESLELVIEGRHPDAGKAVELVEATDAYEDNHQINRRVQTLEWAAGLQPGLDEEFDAPKRCSVTIKLLINCDEKAKIERFWCYFHFLCHFTKPEVLSWRYLFDESDSSENESEAGHLNNNVDDGDDGGDSEVDIGRN